MDHPRSRGEYRRDRDALKLANGSSPLSRGILGGTISWQVAIWIIPALAGNTCESCPLWLFCQDHPRSRGEYCHSEFWPPTGSGSSPLSRGIRSTPSYPGEDTGIIPALAGNTLQLMSRRSQRPDHPRSRGEYSVVLGAEWRQSGSSPLSRGIRRRTGFSVRFRRIIPALAGNTTLLWRNGLPHSDHPRSRGEYTSHWYKLPRFSGSSPLSRGILFPSCYL